MEVATLDVLSVTDAHDEPVLRDCRLNLGGNVLVFKNGRAKIPEDWAPDVARCPKVIIPGYRGPVTEAPPNVSASLENDQPTSDREPAEADLAAAEAYLRSQGIEPPTREPDERLVRVEINGQVVTLPRKHAVPLVNAGQATPVPEEDTAVAGARIEPEPDAEPEVDAEPGATPTGATNDTPEGSASKPEPQEGRPVPDGFEAETADGKARCFARKGDGSQCANASVEDHACHIAAHLKQVQKS